MEVLLIEPSSPCTFLPLFYFLARLVGGPHVYPSSLRNVWTTVIARVCLRVERDFVKFNMSQEEAEDVKPKLNLTINCEGHSVSRSPLDCPLLIAKPDITVKVKPNMLFKKIFEAAEVCGAVVAYHKV